MDLPGLEPPWSHEQLRELLRDQPLPLALLDLDAFRANALALERRAGGLPIRLASKSIRCLPLLELLLELPAYAGVMCFSTREALALSERGLDDLLVAYPSMERGPLRALARRCAEGQTVRLMVDAVDQVAIAAEAARAMSTTFELVIDIDLSLRLPGLHFGVRRSPLHTGQPALALAETIRDTPGVALVGLMGYEAQIAGLPDEQGLLDPRQWLIRQLKARSRQELRERRGTIVDALRAAGHELQLVNGGGTGSLETSREDPSLTELAAGSGLYSPPLFDGYRAFQHRPALFFALRVTRHPAPGIWTCHGGGYVASGPADRTRLPSPHLPAGAELLGLEGAGEVQTPIRYAGAMKLGDPVLFRHAKAGELCEHFDQITVIENGQIQRQIPTYRGEGWTFP